MKKLSAEKFYHITVQQLILNARYKVPLVFHAEFKPQQTVLPTYLQTYSHASLTKELGEEGMGGNDNCYRSLFDP